MSRLSEEDFNRVVDIFILSLTGRGTKVRRASHEKFLHCLFWMLDNGAKWRSLPPSMGNWNTVYQRFYRLSQTEVFEVMFKRLAGASETAHLIASLDGSIFKASNAAAGSKGGKKNRH